MPLKLLISKGFRTYTGPSRIILDSTLYGTRSCAGSSASEENIYKIPRDSNQNHAQMVCRHLAEKPFPHIILSHTSGPFDLAPLVLHERLVFSDMVARVGAQSS